MRFFFILMVALLWGGCVKEPLLYSGTGQKPVYEQLSSLGKFSIETPRPILNGSKSVFYKNYLFLIDEQQGVHVIDFNSPSNPVSLKFIKILGNLDISISNDLLYADSGPHLLVLDISNMSNITLKYKLENQFKPTVISPPAYRGYFECYDASKGWIVGWETGYVESVKCYK